MVSMLSPAQGITQLLPRPPEHIAVAVETRGDIGNIILTASTDGASPPPP